MPEARKSSTRQGFTCTTARLAGDLAKKIGQKIWLNETGGKT